MNSLYESKIARTSQEVLRGTKRLVICSWTTNSIGLALTIIKKI